jgi:hypothetical protein
MLLKRRPGVIEHALTSIPWPADRTDFPTAQGVDSQVVSLFDSASPRLRRYLLLNHRVGGRAEELRIVATSPGPSAPSFSSCTVHPLRDALDPKAYVYRECEAELTVAGTSLRLRLGLLPNQHAGSSDPNHYSWWQWCRAERLWSGELAEAWRIGGHLVPYTTDTPGRWTRPDLTELGDLLNEFCGDILHGDVYLIAWRSGMVQITAHFKSAYFHTWPKPVPAFPVAYLSHEPDLSPCGLMFGDSPPVIRKIDGAIIVQPWQHMRFLASKTRNEELTYLPPAKGDVMPAGVSRSFWFNVALNGASTSVTRFAVSPQWYRQCGVIETDQPGPAASMARRNVDLIDENTQKGGIDTGRVWRYLRRDLKLKQPQEDGAEWEGNLAQAELNLAYQRGDDPADAWELYLHHAYHAADVSVYHGAWMGRLECTAAFTAPLPKFRFGGFLYGYLETGDPYLLELSRSVAGVYMAMEWALQPRSAIGRDSFPITCLMALWDYDPQPLYLDFARQMIGRLLSTQQPDGGFSSQAGAGVLTGVSAKPGVRDIHFGSGILSPFAVLEWAGRDKRWPDDFLPRLRKWADLTLSLQKQDGHWYVEGKSNEPYTLTGCGTILTLIRAGQILNDPSCFLAVQKYLDAMNEKNLPVLGTHSFLSAQYAHVADAVLSGDSKTPT